MILKGIRFQYSDSCTYPYLMHVCIRLNKPAKAVVEVLTKAQTL